MKVLKLLLVLAFVVGLATPAFAHRRCRSNDVYIEDPRNPIEGYLGVEYLTANNWVLGARGYLDLNNLDRDDLDENIRAEVGATYRFGPGK